MHNTSITCKPPCQATQPTVLCINIRRIGAFVFKLKPLFLFSLFKVTASMDTIEDRSEIAFFDVETTVPSRPGQGHAILEFGAILVCPRKLVELGNYSSLVRPADLSLISSLSVRCNGITRDAVLDAPTFRDISDRVYELLHGRIWAGHNIVRFDCARIREAFAEIGKPAPEPKGTIDSLALLTQKFGRRAGDMKMATLATYFGLGKQTHRSLDDVRMNLEVVKYCATVLFLESSLPDVFMTNSWVSPNAITRSRSNGKSTPEGMNRNMNSSLPSLDFENNPTLSPTNHAITRSRSNGKSTPEGMNRNMNSSSPSLNFENNPTLSPTNHAITRSRSKGKSTPEGMNRNMNSSSPNLNFENSPTLSPTNQRGGENHSILSPITCGTGKEVLNQVESTIAQRDPFNMEPLRNEMKTVSFQLDVTMEEQPVPESPEMSSTGAVSEGCSGYAGFLEPDEVSIPSISASLVPFYRGSQRIKILHNNVTLQLCCTHLKVRFGINSKFVDHAGRPRLSIVVDTSPSLCRVLDACDDLAKKLSVDSGSSSEWRPVVIRKNGFLNSSTVRLNISTVTNGNIAIYATEIYQTESSGNMQRLAFSRFDAAELAALFIPGTFVDACFSLDPYDYQQNAGIRLVAKKLTIHSM